MPHDPRILPGAFGDEPKTVPLVVYEKDGTRRVIGEATLTSDKDGLRIEGDLMDDEASKIIKHAMTRLDGFTLADLRDIPDADW